MPPKKAKEPKATSPKAKASKEPKATSAPKAKASKEPKATSAPKAKAGEKRQKDLIVNSNKNEQEPEAKRKKTDKPEEKTEAKKTDKPEEKTKKKYDKARNITGENPHTKKVDKVESGEEGSSAEEDSGSDESYILSDNEAEREEFERKMKVIEDNKILTREFDGVIYECTPKRVKQPSKKDFYKEINDAAYKGKLDTKKFQIETYFNYPETDTLARRDIDHEVHFIFTKVDLQRDENRKIETFTTSMPAPKVMLDPEVIINGKIIRMDAWLPYWMQKEVEKCVQLRIQEARIIENRPPTAEINGDLFNCSLIKDSLYDPTGQKMRS